MRTCRRNGSHSALSIRVGVSTLCNIVGQGVSGGMYIDDIKIYSLTPYLATPVLGRHTDFTETSFVLNWNPVDGAEKYIVNVWYDDLYGEKNSACRQRRDRRDFI